MPHVFRGSPRRIAQRRQPASVLQESNLDWTIVRPPRLTNGPLTGSYRTALGQNLERGVVVSRADVAQFMLRALDHPETIGQVIGIAD
jgi:uncharacterized protein YbjT (DUF2867 family)